MLCYYSSQTLNLILTVTITPLLTTKPHTRTGMPHCAYCPIHRKTNLQSVKLWTGQLAD